MEEKNEVCDVIELYAPLTLAYVGDGIYEILVRTHISRGSVAPVNKLHQLAKSYVAANFQSAYMEYILPILTEEEVTIYKRGRNAKSHTMAKNMKVVDYKRATGFEALFGFLHLKNHHDRIAQLFSIVCENHDEVLKQVESGYTKSNEIS